jgi:LysM repeat protein
MARNRLGVLATAVTVGALALSVSPAEAAEVYVVRPGDSLFAIANRFDVSVATLVSSNGLSLDSVIVPGQRLTVPGASTPTPTPTASGASTYTVRSGDWLSRIASRHGVSLEALLAANGLRPTSLIESDRARPAARDPRRRRRCSYAAAGQRRRRLVHGAPR